jgi:hypothetical protein
MSTSSTHIRTARKTWHCHRCGKLIIRGQWYFAHLDGTQPYGRYLGAAVMYRCHLACATPEDMCCKAAAREMEGWPALGAKD